MVPSLAPISPLPVARRLYERSDTRTFDLLDVALADEMLRVAGQPPLAVQSAGPQLASVTGTEDQVTALGWVAAATAPHAMEAWMLALAPRLTRDVVHLIGTGWTAEAELSVELALALRADDMCDFATQLAGGPVTLDGRATAAAIVAADVPDPALIHFV
ncbi:MAG: hypothetical protein ACLGIA_06310 [Actinomycetes bacterium]